MELFNLESSDVAIITNEQTYAFSEIPKIEFRSTSKELILILCQNTIDILATYISAMNSKHAVMLINEGINHELLANIIKTYQPKWIIGLKSHEGYEINENQLIRTKEIVTNIHPDLAILLSTSGTTGSQKFVRLSYDNIRVNAESIIEYLKINQNERAVMNLPLSYSYGMSIVNSHLLAGASILLTDESVMEKSFWELVKKHKATSIAGVPFTYQMLQRIGFTKMELPYLKTMTQAGGRLNEKLVKHFAEYAKEQNKRFYIMYGQTEAAPRISYIPYEKVLEKSSTIGIAIPGGKLSIDVETEELIYMGANVMMGYAENLSDLANGYELNGVLYTGDTAIIDEDGYFTITGRMKRFIKLFGLRINLDDVEKKLEEELQIPLACTGSDDKLIVAIEQADYVEKVKEAIEHLYKLHKTAFKVKVIDEIPRFVSGKTDYMKLKESCL
ncbi:MULTISPECIES: AMP-binding protein [Lysinibacillus]|jgi:long-chain acyl-CoA synthetase|uniref:Phosphatase n=1 Tax=Lysinibacillus fusiformis TaxID=28031 RepID=A0A2I0V5K9_9BACI|nr:MULTISPECIES: AMP-binding protein [Lysinibacillus]PKU53617.1 phosphatase [Lysinibacillus fusiformis]WCH48422.1 AMP-binding protein [Lysinibacillus sp. OF-1]SCZ07949.1 Acyl-CoA synthetase (AMP-forming)/AMP-acid ligase II [Lysinibacillus sp. SG9]SDB52904.1 Acyl-CoA synthetase (AMP-forming)/AMP-acid ligase II [Lysinibacillus sp. TC-37]SFT17059.1 Acyl-CoA synthetase (AMP-forming)/AMP-acid ligase II [Lysinibacillus sp. SG55]